MMFRVFLCARHCGYPWAVLSLAQGLTVFLYLEASLPVSSAAVYLISKQLYVKSRSTTELYICN